ncbi:MAG: SRPBCC family protein [Deltaproteobacteria bacterium]|nr:SRPBCC family protein [Deltaproteobacteria bacterium]
MGQQHIKMTQVFNAPVDTIFNLLTGHESFGRVINENIKRVIDSRDENKNGLGSVRQIKPFPGLAFEETVITFEPNRLIEYAVSKGSPIKNHRGRMEFSNEQGKTQLIYTIDFEPKLPFLFFGSMLKRAIEKPIRNGLKKLADQYDIQK